MNETTAGATIETTATGHPSAPILAREAGVNPVDYMRSRGFVYDISDEEGLRELFDRGEPVTLYQGFDPTGPSLHAGHMVGIMMLGSMQRLGHRPIALGGGGTAMVGDPSGRTSARELIREEDLANNIAAITTPGIAPHQTCSISKRFSTIAKYAGPRAIPRVPALIKTANHFCRFAAIPKVACAEACG